MKHVTLQLMTVRTPKRQLVDTDFQLGRIQLRKHLSLPDHVCALEARPREAARTLLLEQPSPLESGRAPLLLCPCCADLGCGALCARVEYTDEGVVWSDFAWDGYGPDETARVPTVDEDEEDAPVEPPPRDRVRTLGPFLFDTAEYEAVLRTYASSKPSRGRW